MPPEREARTETCILRQQKRAIPHLFIPSFQRRGCSYLECLFTMLNHSHNRRNIPEDGSIFKFQIKQVKESDNQLFGIKMKEKRKNRLASTYTRQYDNKNIHQTTATASYVILCLVIKDDQTKYITLQKTFYILKYVDAYQEQQISQY